MRFPPSFLDEVRARLPVSEVVGRRVKLRKQGREFTGLSPFNQEKTPSFTVNDQKGFYHDFSSGKHGDIFTFVMETEGLSFPEAVERLAQLAGVPVPKISREAEVREERRKTLYDILELACQYFEKSLASPAGTKARAYLADREISSETQLEFRFGYAPASRTALKEFLGNKGIPIAEMIEAGLLVAGDDIPVPYDRFRDRLIIPIQDQRGRIIAFGGRALGEDIQPKYLNSPETSLFRKGETLFNFHRARGPAHDEKFLVAVEGYLDAISVYQSGMKNVVATMGTALTEEQIQLLWRLASEPVICFDGDKAGQSAAGRSLDRILPVLRTGVSFRFAFLPEGRDPDDLIQESGPESFKSVIRDAIPLWDMVWERQLNKGVVETPDQKAVFERDILDLISQIGDQRVRNSYRFRARAQLVAFFQSLDWQAAIKKKKQGKSFARRELVTGPGDPLVGLEKILLGTLIEYPVLLEIHIEKLMATALTGKLESFKREIYRIYDEFHDMQVITFYNQIDKDFKDILADVHGYVDVQTNRPIAVNLFKRFPLLRLEPPDYFVDRCLNLFFDTLHVRQLERELVEIYSDAQLIGADAELERATNLARVHVEEKAAVARRDYELAEEAREIRRNLAKVPPPWPQTGFSQPVAVPAQ